MSNERERALDAEFEKQKHSPRTSNLSWSVASAFNAGYSFALSRLAADRTGAVRRAFDKVRDRVKDIPRDRNGFLQTYIGLDWILDKVLAEMEQEAKDEV